MIYIDIETQSSVDLKKAGVYRYCESPDFAIQLFSYSVDSGAVETIDFTVGETLPPEIRNALTNPDIIKSAFNATFERVCLSHHLGLPVGEYLPPEQWRCTMIHSLYCGLPMSLEKVGAALKLQQQKMQGGKRLIAKFSKPGSRDNAQLTLGGDDADWLKYKEYNATDVVAEMAVADELARHPVPEEIWAEWHVDCRINDRGMLVDVPLVKRCCQWDEKMTAPGALPKLRMKRLTGLDNPNSLPQLKAWLTARGLDVPSLGADEVDEL